MRKEIFETALNDAGGSVESIITNTWSEQNAYEVIFKEVNKGRIFDLIICGNDDMALGAVSALYRAGLANTKVLGYDGILRAVAAVAEPSNPLVATMRIPPSTYEKRAARYVRDVFQGIGKMAGSGIAISIPFDMNVVTAEGARHMLENAVWDV